MTCRDRPERSGQSSPPGATSRCGTLRPAEGTVTARWTGASPSHRRTPWAPDPESSISPCAAPPSLPRGVRHRRPPETPRKSPSRPRTAIDLHRAANPSVQRQCRRTPVGSGASACPAGVFRSRGRDHSRVLREGGRRALGEEIPTRYDVNSPIRARRSRPLQGRDRRVVHFGTAGTFHSAARARAPAPRSGQVRGRGREGGPTRGDPSSLRSGR